MTVREIELADHSAVARLMNLLWPSCSIDDALKDLRHNPGVLPLTRFVADVDGALVGFVEVSLRSHVDGCEYGHPVGFLEGWFVEEKHRCSGVGATLVRAAEEWAWGQGCSEMGSDTWIDAEVSQQAHQAIGYEVVDRCVHFRKSLIPQGN